MMPSRLNKEGTYASALSTRLERRLEGEEADGIKEKKVLCIPVLYELSESFPRRPVGVIGADGQVDGFAYFDGLQRHLGVVSIVIRIRILVPKGLGSLLSSRGNSLIEVHFRARRVTSSLLEECVEPVGGVNTVVACQNKNHTVLLSTSGLAPQEVLLASRAPFYPVRSSRKPLSRTSWRG